MGLQILLVMNFHMAQTYINIWLRKEVSEKRVFRFDSKYVSKSYTDYENIEISQNKGIQGAVIVYNF